jgi:plastocyanin
MALGCGGSGDNASGSAPKVTVADFSFSPKDTKGQAEHTVKGKGFFSAKALANGDSFSHRFTRPGRFPYVCTLHPTQMRGTVVVRQ